MTRRILFIFIIFIGLISLDSCKALSARSAAHKAERAKRIKAREGQRAYNKAFKRHLNAQDDATKKRIKSNIKQQKKAFKQSGGGKRSKADCSKRE